MEFRILGPLEVWDGGGEVTLGGGKRRALLAVLLLHANEVVPADRLIEELWGADSPEHAADALRVNVSRLRKALPQDVLTTRSPGYVLRVESDELDLHRFERLVDEGRSLLARRLPADASARLRDALSLWRGPTLADFAYDSFAQAAIARLEEIRLAAVELLIDADLALGRHHELVAELEGLVAEHPLRERLRTSLMTALYRSGRQAEALDAYQAARPRGRARDRTEPCGPGAGARDPSPRPGARRCSEDARRYRRGRGTVDSRRRQAGDAPRGAPRGGGGARATAASRDHPGPASVRRGRAWACVGLARRAPLRTRSAGGRGPYRLVHVDDPGRGTGSTRHRARRRAPTRRRPGRAPVRGGSRRAAHGAPRADTMRRGAARCSRRDTHGSRARPLRRSRPRLGGGRARRLARSRPRRQTQACRCSRGAGGGQARRQPPALARRARRSARPRHLGRAAADTAG